MFDAAVTCASLRPSHRILAAKRAAEAMTLDAPVGTRVRIEMTDGARYCWRKTPRCLVSIFEAEFVASQEA